MYIIVEMTPGIQHEQDNVNAFFDYCIMVLVPVLFLVYMAAKAHNPFINASPVIITIIAAVITDWKCQPMSVAELFL